MDKPPFLYHFVAGVPAPQGSKSFKGMRRSKSSGRQIAIMVESSKGVAPWREAVTNALLDKGKPRAVFGDCAVRLTVEFVMVRVGAEPKGWTRHHTKAPDLSKLVRSTEDAITTAGVWCDDSRVVELLAVKRTAEPGEPTGALIMIEKLPEKERPHGKAQAGHKPAGKRRGNAGGRGQPANEPGLALV